MSRDNTMLRAALSCVAEGLKVIPLCHATPDGRCGCGRGHTGKAIGKIPLTKHGLKDATQIQLGVHEYWQKWPEANIGIFTDGLVALDFDGEARHKSKEIIEAKVGKLPHTRQYSSGGGGEHWVYRNSNGINIRNATALGGYQGVDLRANGGYIVAPPSTHKSGRRYGVIDDCAIAPAPAWLVELAIRRPEPMANTGAEPIPEGQRNTKLASLAGTMRRRGMPQAAIEAALVEVEGKSK